MIWPILEAKAEIQKYFCSFLVEIKTSKSHSEINWPLAAGVSNTRIGARAFVASSHHVQGKHCTMREKQFTIFLTGSCLRVVTEKKICQNIVCSPLFKHSVQLLWYLHRSHYSNPNKYVNTCCLTYIGS